MSRLRRIGGTRTFCESLPADGPAFLLFVVGDDSDLLPQEISQSDAWLLPALIGWFVVLPEVPSVDLERVAADLQHSGYFSKPGRTSIAWTGYDGKIVAAPRRLPMRESGGIAVVDGSASLFIGRYGLVVPDGNPVEAAFDVEDIALLRITYLPLGGMPAPNGIGCTIPFSGASRFCLRALGLIGDAGSDAATGADISIRYFVPAGDTSKSVRYPLLDQAIGEAGVHMVADATLDPLTNWWKPDSNWTSRTAYRISGEMYRLVESEGNWSIEPVTAMRLRSAMRTVTGAALYLRPIDASFIPQPLAPDSGQWYLTPCGTFALETETAVGNAQLLCGLAATEFISFTSGDIIRFTPGCAAHATQFPLAGGGDIRSGTALLDTGAVTAWASIHPSGDSVPTFYAQPGSAATYTSAQLPATGEAGIISLYSPLVGTLNACPAFPIVPYASVESVDFDFGRFEREILAPARCQQIAPPGRTPADDAVTVQDAVTAATPQGFLVTIAGTAWSNLMLASNARSNDLQETLSVTNVTPALRSALQNDQLFLVGTLAEPFATLQSVISIADWPFSLEPGEKDALGYRNVLIFKFGKGALLDLAANPLAWADAAAFNADPADVATWLLSYFASAISSASDDPRYQSFVDLIRSDAWNGILALRAAVSLESLPEDLRGLAAGINGAQFAAHHFGVSATRIEKKDGLFRMPASSSLFGLINYIDQDTQAGAERRSMISAAPADDGYAFRVLTLCAQFANSQIVDFDSKIVLTMTRMFGEKVQRQLDSPAPPDMDILRDSTELFGSLEKRIAEDGKNVTVYAFHTREDTRYLFPASRVFNYIEITKIEFNTLKPQDESGMHVQSQFRIWGLLNFKAIPGIDLFSFGDPAEPASGAPPAGLAFSNLVVSMEFDGLNIAQSLAFHFDSTGVAFDIGASSALRKPSLYTGLPVSFEAIVTSKEGSLASLGYLPVLSADLVDSAPLDTGNWYGIAMVLNLGTPGALADISTLNARLVAAWSPGTGGIPGSPQAMVALFIQLPGTAPGKKELALQQVLKLSIDQITIGRQESGALQLVFTNIGLKFLGQKMPSGAVVHITLAGGASGGGSLGWLGTYSTKAPPPFISPESLP